MVSHSLVNLPVPAAKSLLMQDDFFSNLDLKELAMLLKIFNMIQYHVFKQG